ncbi:hypothetical protein IJJ97_04800 [bacterium]|nr:hypothetical protein [bacterium]
MKITAPVRIDLAGGTLDIHPLYIFEDGSSVVNIAIDPGTEVNIEKREDKKIFLRSDDLDIEEEYAKYSEIDVDSKLGLLGSAVKFFELDYGLDISTLSHVPKGSGLAASSSMLVALMYGLMKLKGIEVDSNTFIDWCANIEARLLGIPTGKQDYYSAYFGGLNNINFTSRGIVNENYDLSDLNFKIDDSIILSFTGISHFSGTNNWAMMKRYIDDEENSRKSMHKIKETAIKMHKAVLSKDINEISNVLNEEWDNRKKLAEGVSNEKIDKIVSNAKKAGALASKICGAGGGGCLITLCNPQNRETVTTAIREAGAEILDFKLATSGVKII